jgi:hypothetical protein
VRPREGRWCPANKEFRRLDTETDPAKRCVGRTGDPPITGDFLCHCRVQCTYRTAITEFGIGARERAELVERGQRTARSSLQARDLAHAGAPT